MKSIASTLQAYGQGKITLAEAVQVLSTVEWGHTDLPDDPSARYLALQDIPVTEGRSLRAEIFAGVMRGHLTTKQAAVLTTETELALAP